MRPDGQHPRADHHPDRAAWGGVGAPPRRGRRCQRDVKRHGILDSGLRLTISRAFLSATPPGVHVAMRYTLLGAHAHWVLIGACHPTLCPRFMSLGGHHGRRRRSGGQGSGDRRGVRRVRQLDLQADPRAPVAVQEAEDLQQVWPRDPGQVLCRRVQQLRHCFIVLDRFSRSFGSFLLYTTPHAPSSSA